MTDDDLAAALERWRHAGLLTTTQAEAIWATEGGLGPRPRAGDEIEPDRRPATTEMLVNAGALIGLVGAYVALYAGERSADQGITALRVVTSMAIAAAATVTALRLGRGTGVRRRSAGSLLAVAGITLVIGLYEAMSATHALGVMRDGIDNEDHGLQGAAASLAGLAVFVAGLRRYRSGPLAIAAVVAGYATAAGLLEVTQTTSRVAVCAALCGVGLVLLAVGELPMLQAGAEHEFLRFVALSTSVVALLAAGDIDNIGLAAAAALLIATSGWLGREWGSMGLTFASGLGILALDVDVAVRNFHDAVSASTFLVASGVVLVVAALAIQAMRPRRQRTQPPAAPPG